MTSILADGAILLCLVLAVWIVGLNLHGIYANSRRPNLGSGRKYSPIPMVAPLLVSIALLIARTTTWHTLPLSTLLLALLSDIPLWQIFLVSPCTALSRWLRRRSVE